MIRLEEPRDQEAVRNVNETAFGGPTEADLVEALRQECTSVGALVAELNGEVVGHIPFSPVSIEPTSPKQLMGIGTLLVREGLERCHAVGAEAVVVIGHAEYYPHFGFRPAHGFGLRCEYDVPPEVFMALELVPDFAALARWSRPDQATGPGRPASRGFRFSAAPLAAGLLC